jgi:hypothetical protein
MYTVVDEKGDQAYNDARTTWNKAKEAVMYPDVVTFPDSAAQLAVIVQCAKALEYYMCARNGKHSYESDTCTYGIVVDLDRFSRAKPMPFVMPKPGRTTSKTPQKLTLPQQWLKPRVEMAAAFVISRKVHSRVFAALGESVQMRLK